VSEPYAWIKALHILSFAVLFGTGLGTAFQMWAADRKGDLRAIAVVARQVVRADFLFTTPAVIVQPASGALLATIAGIDLFESWLVAAYLLYALAGICWLPVVVLQIRMRDHAEAAVAAGQSPSPEYRRCMRLWFALGWPAFAAMIVILWLMVAKPELW
jgi:uncharacterized membrane protein